MTLILDGRPIAAALRAELRAETAAFATQFGRPPALTAVEVGADPAAQSYVRSIRRACEGAGFAFRHLQLAGETTQTELEHALDSLNRDNEVDGVIIQIPLPAHLNPTTAVGTLDPRKDVDGLHPLNLGRLAQGLPTLVPNTPAGGIELLRRYAVPLAGRKAVVVGRSNVVGKPMALLLLQEQATVTICHSRTPDLAGEVRHGDIVVVAAGRAGLVTGAMLKPGAVVVDFGINVDAEGKLRGDVNFEEASAVAGAITPVPGGTGPVTNMMLLRNTLQAARDLAAHREA
jgi:methylenetetrahydrofolate dehydrogenase (NADP+)/methenyltetrahydrofolate cyclohydrolase